MSYLPVYCEACLRASLSPVRPDEGTENHRCAFCEQPARVVPGPVYGDDDWLAFSEIDAAIFHAEVDGVQAQLLLEQLEGLRDQGSLAPAIVAFMIGQIPQLQGVKGALTAGVARGQSMLHTLLLARRRDNFEPKRS